jgi:hypothetical protein
MIIKLWMRSIKTCYKDSCSLIIQVQLFRVLKNAKIPYTQAILLWNQRLWKNTIYNRLKNLK